MLKPALKLGGIVAFFAALGIYFWISMRIPAPREQDRVTHRDGLYSIIKPRDWEVSFDYKGNDRYLDTLEIRLPTTSARDRRIFIGRLRQPPLKPANTINEKHFDTQFQGRPAWVLQGRSRLEHYWRALFERNGRWYELVFWTPLEEDVPSSGWWAYLQTFRASEGATTVPATNVE